MSPTHPKLDINFVRAQFPAFSEPSLKDHAYFENAGGSYACGAVIDRLHRFYRERKMQPYAPYAPAQLGGAEMDEARARLSALMGIDGDELSFGPSTTQNTYVLAQAFRQMLAPGDAIIVTNQDHEANSGPWRRLAESGTEVREWKVDPATGHLDPADLAALLDDKVRLVCFPHCSNILGEVNPVAKLCTMIRSAGAWSCVDGVSFAPHGLPDIGALGADIYLFSAYKTFGPHQGIMALRRALAERLPNQGHYFNAHHLTKKFTPAGPDHAQIAASAGMADYVDTLDAHHFGDSVAPVARARRVLALQVAHERSLLAPVLDFLRDRNDLRLLGPDQPDRRVPTVAMVAGRPGEAIARDLAALGVNCSGGDFYATRLMEAMGVAPKTGALRLSFVHYTSKDEVDKLLGALDQVL